MIQFIKHKNWYYKTNKALKVKYKKDYYIFSGLLASTSPRFQIKRNFLTSENIYSDYIKDKKVFYIYTCTNKKEFIKYYKLLPCHYNNIKRILKANLNNNKNITLGGLKVNSFFNNIIGNYNFITIDVHMLKFFNHNKKTFNKSDYIYYSKILIKIFKRLKVKYKLKHYCQIQAIIWEYIRSQENRKPSNFLKYI